MNRIYRIVTVHIPRGVNCYVASRPIIVYHVILHGYGHWLPNDPRGSESTSVRQEKLKDLGPVHQGRKPIQPPREELKQFSRDAKERLEFPVLWFDDAKRQALGESIAELVRETGYAVYACAVMKNHVHLCIRRHRDNAQVMWERVADATAAKLRLFTDIPNDHPIWSNRPYKVYLHTPEDVWRVIAYIEGNPLKEGLAPQKWAFITPYNNWPLHKK